MLEHSADPAPHADAATRQLLARHEAWWGGRGLLVSRVPSAPLGDLWLPLADGTLAHEDLDLRPDLLDADRLAGPALSPGPLERDGDRLRTAAAYARVPWVEAILGCPIRASILGGAMRAHAFIDDWARWPGLAHTRRDEWLAALVTQVDLLVARSGGRYAVTQTLMRGPVDLAEAALGPAMLALSLYDRPADLARFLEEATALFLEVLAAQWARIPALAGGTVNPFGVWAPGRSVRTQCDASAILSPRQYQEGFLPWDVEISRAVPYSLIHLHSGSLHTVPALLAVEAPRAIQVTLDPEPSGPPVGRLVGTFRQILAHKPLIVDGYLTDDQVGELLRALPHGGLYIAARATPD
ncbi:MAG: hypothetical protein GX657_05485 [Chloroflexi bacterium]|jgi:hypothetical protein|nr:hypothetical protein [Chloroflexota bacterium]